MKPATLVFVGMALMMASLVFALIAMAPDGLSIYEAALLLAMGVAIICFALVIRASTRQR